MLGPEENRINQERYDKMMDGPNKFKPGNIITNFIDNPHYINRPVKDWMRNLGNKYSTWKVLSIEPNGDYKLQGLDTLNKEPLKEKDSPLFRKKIISKEVIDFWDNYKLWEADDVKAIYNRGMEALEIETKKDNEIHQHNAAVVAELAPEIQKYFIQNKSIKQTADEFYDNNITMEDVWNVLDENDLILATDYLGVKKKLFGEDDKNFKNFKTATVYILKDNQRKKAATKSVLGNEDLNRKIGEYFKTSKKGGKKSKKREKKSKNRWGKSKKYKGR